MSGRLEGADKVEKEGVEGDLKNHRNAKGLESDFFFFLCSLQNTLGASRDCSGGRAREQTYRTRAHPMPRDAIGRHPAEHASVLQACLRRAKVLKERTRDATDAAVLLQANYLIHHSMHRNDTNLS